MIRAPSSAPNLSQTSTDLLDITPSLLPSELRAAEDLSWMKGWHHRIATPLDPRAALEREGSTVPQERMARVTPKNNQQPRLDTGELKL